MIKWPETLVAELAERRCIIIMGAGASAGSTGASGSKPKDWPTLLTAAIDRFLSNPSDRDEALRLVGEKQYLDAAQIVDDNANKADFSEFLTGEFDRPRYQPSEIHRKVLALDAKIVITTNYDRIYDHLCLQGSAASGYNVCRYYETHALNDIRSTKRVILKAHGCISDPDKIVLTRAHYFNVRNKFPGFYSLLDALFLTNTLLFIGCGLNDPDIQLLLENANIAVKTSRPHYALVSGGRHSSIKSSMFNTYNLRLLEYSTGKHDEAVTALQHLLEAVEAYRAVGS